MYALICDQFSGVCTCEVERDESRAGIPLIPLQLRDKLGCTALHWIILIIIIVIIITKFMTHMLAL